MRRRLILLVPLLALFAFVATTEERAEGAPWNCEGTHIFPGGRPENDIDAVINTKHPTGTRFCVHAGTYPVSEPAILKTGDKLEGEPGTETIIDTNTIAPIRSPMPVVKLEGRDSANLLRARGVGISIRWVDLSGASGVGSGSGAITAGSASSDFLVEFARIHENASAGITNMKGRIFHSEFFENSKDPRSHGYNASAIKGITEYEAGHLYVHDEQGNGLWCDVGCSPDQGGGEEGFWVHDSVVVNSGRAGIRYENSSNKALFNNNEVHGNGRTQHRGGIDIRDAQNAWVGPNNNFGKATIAGVVYPTNFERIGVRATGSGRTDRVRLRNVDVVGNNFGLVNNNDRDGIVTCGGEVFCGPNTNVGTR